MQTNGLLLASGMPRLASDHDTATAAYRNEAKMSDTASIRLTPTNGFFSRFLASVDRLLLISANVAVRNGDLPYFGL